MTKDLGKRIRALRTTMGFTQTQLAEAAQVSQANISDIEGGNKNPSLDTISAIARALHTVPSYLMGEKVCTVCGFEYTYDEALNSEAHKSHHAKVEKLIQRHGFYWPYQRRLWELNEARDILTNKRATDDDKYLAAVNLFKALFCRSLFAYPRADHPVFDAYVAMLLGGDRNEYFEDIPETVIARLKQAYGSRSGEMIGTYYQPEADESAPHNPRIERIASYLPYLSPGSLDIIDAVIKADVSRDNTQKKD